MHHDFIFVRQDFFFVRDDLILVDHDLIFVRQDFILVRDDLILVHHGFLFALRAWVSAVLGPVAMTKIPVSALLNHSPQPPIRSRHLGAIASISPKITVGF